VQGELFLRAGVILAERCAIVKSREAVLRRAARQAALLVHNVAGDHAGPERS
jgi:hypothetical protein